MPTSVHMFLQQVETGLWEGTSIHLNSDHVIAARPASGDGQHSKLQQFEKAGLSSLPFDEYNDKYPHVAYTVGFVNKGPAFFINKKTNAHRDACFGNIVIGRATVDKIATFRGFDHDPIRIRPVDIVGAKFVDLQDLNERASKEYTSNHWR